LYKGFLSPKALTATTPQPQQSMVAQLRCSGDEVPHCSDWISGLSLRSSQIRSVSYLSSVVVVIWSGRRWCEGEDDVTGGV